MSRKMTAGIDYTNRDYEAYREMMIQELQKKMPEYTDLSSTDAGIVMLECLANGLDICSLYNDVVANDVVLATTQDRKMAVILARNLGYTPYNQTASITPQVFILNSVKDSDYIIGKGTVVKTKDSQDMVTQYFETMNDLVIPKGALGNETDESGNYLYQVNVQHGTSVKNDSLGSSTGAPFQSFKLNFPNVLIDALEVYVNEGDGKRKWTRVDSFFDSTLNGDSRVYTVSIDEFDNCYVEFGNNIRGKIPNVYQDGITANYRIGGGTVGNVQANTITVLDTSLAFVDSTFNPVASTTKGHEKETLEEIKENAPAKYRTRDRAVTLGDYGDLLMINNEGDFYGVYRAKATRDTDNGLFAHIYYQMRDGYEMTDNLLEQIKKFYEPRIIIGTELDINPYEPYVVDIEATLIVDKDYSMETLKSYVESYIKDTFFAPNAFTFGDGFVMSDLESEVKSTFEGVRSLRISSPVGVIINADKENQIIELGTLTLNCLAT